MGNQKQHNTMDLREFIAKTLEDICFGIRDAQKKVSSEIGSYPIAPAFIDGKPVYQKEKALISFDISVGISENVAREGKGGLAISVLNATIGQESLLSNERTNRIQFSVPYFPQALNAKEKAKE